MVAIVLALVTASAALAALPGSADVDAVARELRCVVCQTLSVADSPSDMAKQMRDVVRERLQKGETPEAIKAYFVERYGEWVLLSPPSRGFPLVAWVLPLVVLAGGLVVAVIVLARWTGRRGHAEEDVADSDIEALRAQLREGSQT